MPRFDFTRDIATKCWNRYSEDLSKGLLEWGAAGWVLSSLAQLYMISTSKDFDPKKKKFLLPQEAADGAINVGLFYTLTAGFKKIAENLVESGRIYGEKTRQFVMEHKNNTDTFRGHIKGASENFDHYKFIENVNNSNHLSNYFEGFEKVVNKIDYKKLKSGAKYEGLMQDGLKYFDTKEKGQILLSKLNEAKTEFLKLKNFTVLTGTILGSVVASSIITPIVRNEIANRRQKRFDKNIQIVNPKMTPMPKTSLPPPFRMFTK